MVAWQHGSMAAWQHVRASRDRRRQHCAGESNIPADVLGAHVNGRSGAVFRLARHFCSFFRDGSEAKSVAFDSRNVFAKLLFCAHCFGPV